MKALAHCKTVAKQAGEANQGYDMAPSVVGRADPSTMPCVEQPACAKKMKPRHATNVRGFRTSSLGRRVIGQRSQYDAILTTLSS